MPDWTAITGIIVSGVVGPSVGAGFALWRQRVDHQHDRQRDDLIDARLLLDEASQELRRARELGHALGETYSSLGPAFARVAAATIEEFKTVCRDQALTNERLMLRFGDDSPIVEAHTQAIEGATVVGTALGLFTGASKEFERTGSTGAMLGVGRITTAQARFRKEAHEAIALRINQKAAGARAPGRSPGG